MIRRVKLEVVKVWKVENEALRKQLEKMREKEVAFKRLLGQIMLENYQMRERYSK